MNFKTKAGFIPALLVLAIPAGVAGAADLGSIKDGYSAPAMPAMFGGVGNCYVRGGVGYSVSADPTVTWPVNNGSFDASDNNADGFADGDLNYNNIIDADEIVFTRIGDAVSNVSLENTWLAEGGIGCGSGSRGLRAEIMFGYHGERKLDGEPLFYNPGPTPGDPAPGHVPPPDMEDPLHTDITTYTAMLNVYHDLGNFNRIVPYVGAGVGVAYNVVDNVYFTENPFLLAEIEGQSDLSFAWALMAGIGYQISDRAILDVGYRYIDMGAASSGRVDTAGYTNPRVEIDDIAAHEIKVGLRYHFGESSCCAGMPMK